MLLSSIEAITSIHLRVFVTSRPELPIKLEFRKMSGDLHQDVIPEEVQTIVHQLEDIKTGFSFRQPDDALPSQWPGKDKIRALVHLTVPLFIVASTVCRYISEEESNPGRRLESLLQQGQNEAYSTLERIYLPILYQIVSAKDKQEQQEMEIARFRVVGGPIVLLAEPLSVLSLSELLDVERSDIRAVLNYLHSVLQHSTPHCVAVHACFKWSSEEW